MNHPPAPSESQVAAPDTPRMESQTGILCPLPALPTERMRFDNITGDLCGTLTAEGCPLAPVLDERLRFETLLAELSAAFVSQRADKVDTEIESALRRIVEFLDVDRGAFMQYSADQRQSQVTHFYVVPGIPPFPYAILDDQLPWYAEKIRQGEVLRFSRLPEEVPPEAVREREFCIRQGLKSNLTIPVKIEGAMLGVIGFGSFRRYRDWPDELVRRLRLVGEIFANALARKQADLALWESEARFRLMADTAPVMVWMSGPDRLCTYFNKPWLDFTGRPLQRELGDGWSEGVHPDDLQRCLDTYVRAYEAGQGFRMEYRLRRFDGEYRWVIDMGAPRFESDGTFEGYIGSCIDITDRKRVEEALRESEARLRLLLESTNAIPWVADAKSWRFTYVGSQASKLFGYSADEWYGESFWTDHMHPDDRGWAPAFCRDHSQRDTDYEFDYRMVAADGRTVWLHDVVNVIREDGAPAFLRGFLIDVTRRKDAEVEAQHLRDQLTHVRRVTTMGELAAAIAHEINQPLCAIVSNSQAAQRLLAGDAVDLNEVRETLQDIVADSQRASEVIARIRDLLQKRDPERKPFDLNVAIREVLALMKSQLTRNGVTIALDLAANLPPVLGDRVQLQQVLLNLVLNAIEAMSYVEPEQRELSVRSTRDREGAFTVSVRDSGPGIAAEQVEQVFDAFFTTKPGGIGIGLAISRSILSAHGGRIWADAAAGDGAAFHFILPAAKETFP